MTEDLELALSRLDEYKDWSVRKEGEGYSVAILLTGLPDNPGEEKNAVADTLAKAINLACDRADGFGKDD